VGSEEMGSEVATKELTGVEESLFGLVGWVRNWNWNGIASLKN
jgi:hypothetical protein